MSNAPQRSSGADVLQQAAIYKSTAYDRAERDALGLRGLLPYRVTTLKAQSERALENLRRKAYDIERYIFLSSLQDRNETLFYRLVIDNIAEIMPLIYTPTVGQACKEFAHIFRRPRGFYITREDRGQIRGMLDNWPNSDVRVIVITDGERILGLGDLGANGMGIPIGKLALYTACGGISPEQVLPVMFDVGTNNQEIREDPLYLGYPEPRLEGDPYFELMDEFMEAVQDKFPGVLVQFEDFLTPRAYGLLQRYRDKYLCFNDDIQGTAAVVLAGILSAARARGVELKDLRIMFLGAGSAATGIGDLLAAALREAGLSESEAAGRLWFVDKEGLLVASRTDLAPHNLPYAHDHQALGFEEAIEDLRPHALIGATGVPGLFSESVVRKMASVNEQPVIFALSNPTSRAECTAEQAYEWTDGRVLFASGSPFDPVEHGGRTYRPAQGNNAYAFPGIGLGAVVARATSLPEGVFLTAARTLAGCVTPEDLEEGALYPRLPRIREVSAQIAADVVAFLDGEGLAQEPLNGATPEQLLSKVEASLYDPTYD